MTEGVYTIIYKHGKTPYGDVRSVQKGDVIRFFDGGYKFGDVSSSIMGSGDRARVKIQARQYRGLVVQDETIVYLKQIDKVLRLPEGLQAVMDPDTLKREYVPVKPPPPPPPLPEVQFKPVTLPGTDEIVVLSKDKPKDKSERVGPNPIPLEVPTFSQVIKPIKVNRRGCL